MHPHQGWIAARAPNPLNSKNMQTNTFVRFFRPTQRWPGGFLPTNADLADILDNTDFYFENFFFYLLDPELPDVQVPDFQISSISRFPDFQIPRFGIAAGAAARRTLRSQADPSPNTLRNQINSEGFLAEVFHPWVRWEGPGSGFENSSGAGGVWVGPSWAQVGGPKLGPAWVGPRRASSGWAHVGGPRIHRFGPHWD